MNTDNNLENSMGSESLGVAATPVNNEPINNGGEDNFVPFQDLNNAPLNVPTENADVQPTPIVQTEPLDVQPTLYQPEPVQAPIEQSVDMINQAPVADESVNTFIQPPVEEPVTEVTPTFDTMQAAPTVENIEVAPNIEAIPSVEPTYTESAPTTEPAVDNNLNQDNYTVSNDQPMVNSPETQGPTIPIPDQMPGTDYQAGVSTPVDYATPMSDFDQIGTSPELDPKAKGKKNNKGLLFLLLILLIVALGAGSYYAINVLGIFNKESVTLKEVTVEKGEQPSSIIDDYATFNNTSSSNCSLDTSNVNTSTVGQYDFKVTCGEKSYTGKVTVKDTKGPQIEAKTNVIIAGTVLLPETLVKSADEEATYAYESDQEKDNYLTAGLKKVKLVATDSSSNSKTYYIPVIVTSSEYSYGIASKKDVTNDTTNATIIEKNVILYNNSAGMVNDTSYTAYIITFNSAQEYASTVKNYDDSGVLTFGNYSGIPVFYKDQNTIVLVKDIDSSLIKEDYNTTYMNITQSGYQGFLIDHTGTNKNLLEFNGI